MTDFPRSDASFAPDGVCQPTAETADNGLPDIDTPEPLDESAEPVIGNPQPLPGTEPEVMPADVPASDEAAGSDGAFGGEAEIAADAPVESLPPQPGEQTDTGGDGSPQAPAAGVIGNEPELTAPASAAIPVMTSGAKVFIGSAPVAAPEPEPEEKLSWFQRLKRGLSRTSRDLSSSITGIFTKRKLDEDTLQDLEDVLIRADLGMETAIRITDTLSAGRYGKDVSDEEVRAVMRGEIEKVLGPVAKPLELDLSHKPHVILVVGVNGTGKTTTIGKLAAKLREAGLSVWLAAGDTFRAAAIEQLHIWGERTGSPVVSNRLGADAAGLAFDAFEKAKAAGADVLIIDTAGRLQNKAELMDELAKIVRVLGKLDPEAPHTVLQTLDATTGQNALNQVEIFRNVAGVNGLVMTKLDGTARGGILVAIAAKHKLPVYFVGVGEKVADLEPFSASEFAAAIAGTD
jgi:fused signal recognition particle receptor